jgi:hypothetical protein
MLDKDYHKYYYLANKDKFEQYYKVRQKKYQLKIQLLKEISPDELLSYIGYKS